MFTARKGTYWLWLFLLPSAPLPCLFIAASESATAQETGPGTSGPDNIYRAGNGVSKPSLISKVEPGYSSAARKLQAEGEVVLYAVINPDGTAQNLRVIKSLGYGLDEEAIGAVQKWRFGPGMKDGKAVAVIATVEVHFRLGIPPNGWHSGQMKFALGAGILPPVVTNGTMPKAAGEALNESAAFEFTVDSMGSVKNIRATHGSSSATELLAGHLKNWRFRPAMQGNQAVNATGQVQFKKGLGDETVIPIPSPTPRTTASSSEAGGIRTMLNPKDGLVYVWIQPGAFTMGCSQGDTECNESEKPSHAAGIAKAFWLGRTEVTQAAYKYVMGGNPSRHQGDQLPVESVTWNDAVNYCTAVGGRLPAEAEWEYAARAGVAAARYGNLQDVAWYSGNSDGATHPVALKQANAFGLYDMLGNVWEWVEDAYPGSSSRILKGGSPFMDSRNVRASSRLWVEPSGAANGRGFRCALNVPPGDSHPAPISNGPGSVVSPGGTGGSRPQLIHKVEPAYSEAASKQRIMGVVVLRIVVDVRGDVTNATVTVGLGFGLDEKAIEAVKQWKFRPAYKDGKPVETAVNVEVGFRLQ